MQGFEGMPQGDEPSVPQHPVPTFSRAPLELSGKNADLHTLRTFQSDLADTIKSGEGSLVKIAMAEHNKLELEKQNVDPASRKNIAFVLGGIILVVVAVGVIGYAIYQKIPKTVPLSQNPVGLPTVITVNSTQGLNVTALTRDNIANLLGATYINATPTLNTVGRILPFTQTDAKSTQHIVTTSELFTMLESQIPPELVRSFDPTFTMGVYAYDGNGLFIAFKTDSYTTAFAGMLAWEHSMFDELYRIFAIKTGGTNADLFTSSWKDRVIRNQDTRALLDTQGNVVLFYTFLGQNKDVVIIADKESTLNEVVNRLTANNLLH
jgi:hypothetical protein